jgi:ACS family glucarate transporter-like MFS transporter
VRFLFGAGEAGALPNAARMVARWFPPGARGPAQGIVITSALVGGACAPVITEHLIGLLGWRWAFAVLGIPGVLWAFAFYRWYRDDPAQHPAANARERRYISGDVAPPPAAPHPAVPWARVLTSANVWLLGGVVTCGAFTTYMFFSWYPTYLQKARDVPPLVSGWLASMVLAAGAIGSLAGGFCADWLVRRTGSRGWSRSGVGFCALGSAAAAMIASVHIDAPWGAACLASWASLAIHFQLASWWAAVTDISGRHLGALFGLMNSLGVPGAVASQLFLGWFVDRLRDMGYTGRDQWDPAFLVYGLVLVIGSVCWLFIDVTQSAVE